MCRLRLAKELELQRLQEQKNRIRDVQPIVREYYLASSPGRGFRLRSTQSRAPRWEPGEQDSMMHVTTRSCGARESARTGCTPLESLRCLALVAGHRPPLQSLRRGNRRFLDPRQNSLRIHASRRHPSPRKAVAPPYDLE